MEQLTIKEEMAKLILTDSIIPILKDMLEKGNPEEFKKWGGNCCRQTAYVCHAFLSVMLPHFEWSIWDGIFKDGEHGQVYNHAWVYGATRELGKKRRLFVDLARIHTSDVFIAGTGNGYPKNDPEYADLIELNRERLDPVMMGEVEEYFTKIKGIDLLKEIKKRMEGTAVMNRNPSLQPGENKNIKYMIKK